MLPKSSVMPINIPSAQCETLKASYPFWWSQDKISYLWVTLTPKISYFFTANYLPCVSRIQNILKCWQSYPISFLGRVTAVKMNILPTFLYLFRALPISITKSFVDRFLTDITKFIWQDRCTRFSRHILCRPQSKHGLHLPNFWMYYLVSRFSQIGLVEYW